MKKACDGLVLRVTDSGENDRALTVLTAEEGKLHIIAKGARSVRSRNASLCRILSYSNLELHKKNDLYWLMGGSLNNAFFGINSDLEAFSLASYIAEIADEISGENFPAHEVLQMTLNTLYAIENGLKPLWQIKATYELFAANISGFMPDLVACRDCGKESFEGELWLDVMNGAIVCPECLSKKNGSLPVPETDRFETRNILLPLDASALAAMRYIATAPLKRIFAYGLSSKESADYLCRAAEIYLLNHLERGFDTLTFYHTVTK